MVGARGLGQLLGERLKELREERGLSQEEAARHARRVGLPWVRATVEAFEAGRRRSVALEELILLSHAFEVEPGEWFVGRGWAGLSPDAMASLKVIRAMLQGSPTAHWVRIGQRLWSHPEFDDAPRGLGAQFEQLNEKLRRAEEFLGPGFAPAAAIHAMEASAGPAEVRAAYKMRVKPLDVALAGIRLWGRSLTQERNRRVGAAAREATFRSLQVTRGHVTRQLMKELAPTLKRA